MNAPAKTTGTCCPYCGSDFKHDIVRDSNVWARLWWAGEVCSNADCHALGKGCYVDAKTAADMRANDVEAWKDKEAAR